MSQYNDINHEIEGVFRELYEYSRYALARIDEANHELSQRQHILEPQDVLLMCRQHRIFRHFQHSNFPDWKRHGFPAFWKKVLSKRN